MALTIDDIYDKEFALKGGGYDRNDVDQFLDEICDEMTNMQERIDQLESDLSKARAEPQSKVEADTMTMMATSAATGTCETQGLSSTMRISKNAPANSVDRRPKPP